MTGSLCLLDLKLIFLLLPPMDLMGMTGELEGALPCLLPVGADGVKGALKLLGGADCLGGVLGTGIGSDSSCEDSSDESTWMTSCCCWSVEVVSVARAGLMVVVAETGLFLPSK